jgi:hypothetical protein
MEATVRRPTLPERVRFGLRGAAREWYRRRGGYPHTGVSGPSLLGEATNRGGDVLRWIRRIQSPGDARKYGRPSHLAIVAHNPSGVCLERDLDGTLKLPVVAAIDTPAQLVERWLEVSGIRTAESLVLAAAAEIQRDSTLLVEAWLICTVDLRGVPDSTTSAVQTNPTAWAAMDPIERTVLERLREWHFIAKFKVGD